LKPDEAKEKIYDDVIHLSSDDENFEINLKFPTYDGKTFEMLPVLSGVTEASKENLNEKQKLTGRDEHDMTIN